LPQTRTPIKHVELNDEWESYLINFNVFWPIDHEAENLALETDRTGVQVMKMQRTKDVSNWMHCKYGMSMRPW
jgi:hypothetical protein